MHNELKNVSTFSVAVNDLNRLPSYHLIFTKQYIMKFTLLLATAGVALAGCGDGGRDAPPAAATYVCQTNHKSPFSVDVKNKYIPYFQGLSGQNCITDGGCCNGMYKNAKMCGNAGGEDCALVATALKTLVDQCTSVVDGKYLAGGGVVSTFLLTLLVLRL